jgi:hypothetical protein
MKNTPSISSHESIFLPETNEPIVHDVETHEEIPEENNNSHSKEQETKDCKILW